MSVRCLAFTTTHRRPHMALCCVLQMRTQTFPIRHVIRVSTDGDDTDYSTLLKKGAAPQTRVVLGPNGRQHANYVEAIKAEPGFDQFDLYFKIDDDDFYSPDYVLNVVDDWIRRRWNVSSTSSDGLAKGTRVLPDTVRTLGPIPEEGPVPLFEMPGTLVFDRKGLACILALQAGDEFEDRTWRRAWLAANLDVALRERSDYTYHVHGSNCSTGHWLERD